MSKLTLRELGTVLAALHLWEHEPDLRNENYMDVATDGGTLQPLDEDEIDDLIYKLNSGDFVE